MLSPTPNPCKFASYVMATSKDFSNLENLTLENRLCLIQTSCNTESVPYMLGFDFLNVACTFLME